MFLKNYASAVAVHITIGRIEQLLLRCGVTGIMKEYGIDGKISAITFRLESGNRKDFIRLPANAAAAQDALYRDYMGDDLLPDGKVKYSSRKRREKKSFAEQAERTAWKIVQDWAEVQMSMVQMGQADPLEVFLPYLYDGRRTYYQAMKEANFAGLLTNHSD